MEEIKEKQCTKCGEIKLLTGFSKKTKSNDGYDCWCKICKKKHNSKFYKDNKEQCSNNRKLYYITNIEIIKEHHKQYYICNKEKVITHQKKYIKNKRNTDTFFRMVMNIRNRTKNAIHKYSLSKESSTMQMLGCDKETLMNHLQSTGMRYDPNFDIYNYDSSLYHIDHIKTFADVSKGIYTLDEVCHYTNLQILPAEVNLSKGDTSW